VLGHSNLMSMLFPKGAPVLHAGPNEDTLSALSTGCSFYLFQLFHCI